MKLQSGRGRRRDNIRIMISVGVIYVTAMLCSPSAHSAGLPADFSANYSGHGRALFFLRKKAKASITLSTQGERVKYEQETRISRYRWYECTSVTTRDGDMFPVEFVHVDESRGEKNIHSVFDQQRRSVHTTIGEETPKERTRAFTPPVWDPLSVQLKLMTELAQGRKGNYSFTVVSKGKPKEYVFNVVGLEKVETQAGQYDAWKVKRISRKNELSFWFAPDLDYIPVKMRVEADWYTSELTLANIHSGKRPASSAPECSPVHRGQAVVE